MKAPDEAPQSRSSIQLWMVIGIAAVIGAVSTAAIAGWVRHGTTILFTLAQDGLAWCF